MKKIYLFLVTMVFALAFVACQDDQTTTVEQTTTEATTTAEGTTTEAPTTEPVPIYEERVVNDDYTLIIQSSTMDGVFNPFFSSSAYDNQVIGLVNVSLLGLDETGAVVASDYYPSVAQSYSIFYTDDLTGYTEKEAFEEGDYVVYDIVLKNGALFSDGNEIDAEDVLFNYYTYLDPSYNGSSTLYTLPILGLQDYRTQVAGSAQFTAQADAILADDGRINGYVQNDVYTEDEFNFFWDAMEENGIAFAQEISDYVNGKYLTQAYIDAYSDFPGVTPETISASTGFSVAFGMSMWGYVAEVNEAVTEITGWTGTVYTIADLTAADYWYEIIMANTGEDGKIAFAGGYQGLSDYESAGSDFVGLTYEDFIASKATGEAVPTIAGLVQGTTTVDGEEHDTVKIILTEQNPKAILSLGVTIAPQHYYTAGWTPTAEAIVNYGVEFDNALYMEHLASYNSAPMGAGSHVFVEVEADETVTFERNEYFYTMGGENVYNSNINKIALKIVQSGAEYSALEADDVHYATVSATADVMNSIGLTDDLVAVLVDNLGYGYICINPQVYPNLNERIALTSVFDMSQVLNYYPNGLADLITRSMSQVSWAYPEGADYIYPFDETLASAISNLEAAGYTYDETTGEFTDTPTYKFYLPSGSDSHPAGGVYIRAQELLATIGVTVEIVVDTNLIANIKTTPTGVYALAWGSALDPDMYQVNHYESQANSVISNGIVWLHENGSSNDLGTLDVVKMDGTTVTMNQTEALEYLAELIELGVKYMLPEERAPIYAKALEVLAQLNIEIPTYQRKNLFVYNGDVIDQTTVSTTVTPYWGPLAEIWKVSFADGTTGNQTVQVIVGYEGQN